MPISAHLLGSIGIQPLSLHTKSYLLSQWNSHYTYSIVALNSQDLSAWEIKLV